MRDVYLKKSIITSLFIALCVVIPLAFHAIPDGGKIILQKSVAIRNGDTPEILQKRVMEEAEWKILPEATELICSKIFNKG